MMISYLIIMIISYLVIMMINYIVSLNLLNGIFYVLSCVLTLILQNFALVSSIM